MTQTQNWLEIAQARNVNYPGLENQLNGMQGEEEFLAWLNEFGSGDLVVYRNLWLYNGYRGEIDFLIISRTKWLMVEVKNYEGIVQLGENETCLNAYSFDKNPLEQVNRSLGILKRIVKQLPFKQIVESALVFINNHCKVLKTDSCFGIPVYCRNELKTFIQELVIESKSAYYSKEQFAMVEKVINKHKVDNPYEKADLDDCDFSQAHLGFTCSVCQSSKINVRQRQVFCPACGNLESKRNALVRTVKDYCLLYQKDTFTSPEIYYFIGGLMSMEAISKILNKNFVPKPGFQRKYYTLDEIE